VTVTNAFMVTRVECSLILNHLSRFSFLSARWICFYFPSSMDRRDKRSKLAALAELKRAREGGGRTLKVRDASFRLGIWYSLSSRKKTQPYMTKSQKISTGGSLKAVFRGTISLSMMGWTVIWTMVWTTGQVEAKSTLHLRRRRPKRRRTRKVRSGQTIAEFFPHIQYSEEDERVWRETQTQGTLPNGRSIYK